MNKILNKDLRRRILEEGYKRNHGHYGSSMSCLDTIKHLYDNVLTKDDVFILSKGHGAPSLHVVLEERGITPPWSIHLEYKPKQGIEATSGSLGHGLPISLGRAYAKTLQNQPGQVYCMVGDGEMQEGSNWEALMIAHRLGVENLNILVDWNKYQAIDSIKEVMYSGGEDLKKKLEAFNCNVQIINGHDEEELKTLNYLSERKGLNAIILDTIKGKGIKFLEENPTHHVLYMKEHEDIYKKSLEDLA